MLSEIFSQVKNQWVRSKYQKKHPFRYFVLSTFSSSSGVEARTVVLRDFNSESVHFTIYTDERSKKLKSLQEDKRVCLLFYDPKKLWQVKVDAVLLKESRDSKLYAQLPPPARKDYTTQHPPGSPIGNPEEIDYVEDKNHFVALEFEALAIESLKLKRPHHVRTLFERKTNWEGSYLVP